VARSSPRPAVGPRMSEARAGHPERALRAAVVGVSTSATCGVRDHATLLAEALGREGITCTTHWLTRREHSIRGARTEFRSWTAALAGELESAQPAAVILHYSVFSYAYRGFPLYVRPVLAALRRSGVPVITVLHEFAYPWKRGGLHGRAWSITQNALLREVMRASAAVVVTAPFRAGQLASRPWLPRRPHVLAPVFSNLPPPAVGHARPDSAGHVVGLFGYAYEGAARSLVLDALRLLDERGLPVQIELLGAPGRDTPAARAWLAGARDRGIADSLSFSGVLSAQDLSDAIAACDVLLHPEPSGPTSRKGTLAASLASGRAVVAIDGPRRWSELIESEAALVVEPTASALADAVAALLEDEPRRRQLGERGGRFARRAMSVERSAQAVGELIEQLLSGRVARSPR
jgi:glycosyltransferase involved in cell wall biosynthesis